MTVVADITVPAGDFPFGNMLDADAPVTVRLDRIVPFGESVRPYVWVNSESLAVVEEKLATEASIDGYEVVHSVGDEHLVGISWNEPLEGLAGAIHRSHGTLLEAIGHDGRWRIQLRFDAREGLSSFSETCADEGVDYAVERILDRPGTGVDGWHEELTGDQRETLETALERGYFDVPRRTDLSELSAALGVSNSAVSQRLRRGTGTVLRHVLGDPDEG